MKRRFLIGACGLMLLATSSPFQAATKPSQSSEALEQEWKTPAEASEYRTTPRYDETMAYLKRMVSAAPRQLRLEVFGATGEGRDLVVAIASKDGVFNPAALHKAGRPIVLIQNSIHAGEMDGKDSCLALLRDMVITKEQAALLEKAVVVVIPIYNADGHERFGPYNRINQNGPEEMGWRTQSMNLNLNRDYMKADAPETRAFLTLWNRWLPDFFVDDHVTDGADYEYDVTYNLDTGPEVYPPLAEWQRETLAPALEESVTRSGHAISPVIFLRDDSDPSRGLSLFPDTPRFSTGYMVLQNRPGMLVEMHMLKDYRTRVTGNYEILRAMLQVVNRDADTLVRMNRAADEATLAAGRKSSGNPPLALRLEAVEETVLVPYRSFGYTRGLSVVSGGIWLKYTAAPLEMSLPKSSGLRITKSVVQPLAYIIPAQWASVISVLRAHGVRMRRTSAPWRGEVETYRCEGVKWQEQSFEGRQVLIVPIESKSGEASQGACRTVRERLSFPKGSAVVPLDQRTARVAIHFLEPEAPDSAVAWGFFNAVFEQKEYGEAYVLEKLAREMMDKDPKLAEEFAQRVASDKAFASDPSARLDFFYRSSPWWDTHLGLYPVGRLSSLEGIPLAP
ncbi:MAG: M14 family metallopeptidase [Acidobacteria bacterium]|nr:M14 family metallopeptidase [Acidobacteriota bacterium]